MANMRPSELPEDIRKEPFRQSEITFFDVAKQLPDNWFVLYGVTWFLRIRNNSWSEGEADFVIISPDTGIVVIEVKGGRIGRDDKGWYSVDRNQEIHYIKDPTLQAANCKHKLLACIRNHPKFSERFLPAKHMVCFPNVTEKDSPNLIEAPRDMQILVEDLENLKEHILNFSKRTYDEGAPPKLTQAECLQIVNILKPNFNCPNRWSIQADRQNAIIDLLTDEQNNIWDMIADNDRVSISGPAGSGKTILALKSLKYCIEDNKKALVLVPSNSLKEYYKASIDSPLLDVYTYHLDANCESFQVHEPYPLVVIDEAQDITDDEWIYIYNRFDIEKSDKFVCVFDSNQRLSKGVDCPMEKLVSLKLTKVIRNTREIAELSTKFFRGNFTPSIIGPSGEEVQFTEVENIDVLEKEVIKAIRKYVFEEGFEFSDIVVLFGEGGQTKFKKIANNTTNALGVSFRSLQGTYSSYTHKSGIIIADSVYRFRGLESKVVILTGIDDLIDNEKMNACYIGASRAKNVLHIFARKNSIDYIKSEI